MNPSTDFPDRSMVEGRPAITLCRSQGGQITRHVLPLGGCERLHQFHHVDAVGALYVRKSVHGSQQVFVTLPGETWRRQAALEILLMAYLADRHSVGLGRSGGGVARRP